jgi:hypothetical protein
MSNNSVKGKKYATSSYQETIIFPRHKIPWLELLSSLLIQSHVLLVIISREKMLI